MNVKCPRCNFKGEVVDGKCQICELPIEPSQTKNIYTIAVLILAIILAGFAIIYVKNNFLKGDLKGEMFIVTKGGQNIRLSLVEVRIIPKETFSKFGKLKVQEHAREIQRLKVELENSMTKVKAKSDTLDQELTAIVEVDRLEPQVEYIKSLKFIFNGIPEGVVKTSTDADGKFNLRIKRNAPFYLFAHGSRLVFGETEDYFWLIPINLEGKSSMELSLNNTNLFSEEFAKKLLKP